MNLLLLGMNHRTAPLALRERFAVSEIAPVLTKLCDGEIIEEAVLVSTCNRVEVVVVTKQPAVARMRLRSFFERDLDRSSESPSRAALDDALYAYQDAEAAQHVFRVACAIDSMVVGEPQILGQVKDAYRAAVACGTCGSILTRLYERAFAAAKRVRNETRIAERPVSVARVAADLAREIFDDLREKNALLIGAGEMIELALEAMRGAGLGRIRIVNRTRARAAALAGHFDGSAHGFDELPALLEGTDIVLSCIGGDGPVVTREVVARALRARRRPLFVIDIGVPRNVEPSVDALDEVFLYDIDDLAGMAEANAEERGREKVHAEAIVVEEHRHFDGWLMALGAVPTIRDLREQAEGIRAGELDRHLGRLALSEPQREGVEALTRALVNKLMHAPLATLRAQEDREQGLAVLEAARRLFGLDEQGSGTNRSASAAGAPDPDPDAD